MFSVFYSAAINGIDGLIVNVESSGIGSPQPRLDIIGLPDAAVKEAAGRVRSAARSCSLSLKKGLLTVNLAPADIKKEGSSYDLPILLSLIDHPTLTRMDFSKKCFVGELSLSGELRSVSGALPMAIAARDAGFRELYLPAANALEASAAIGIKVFPAENARQVFDHLLGGKPIIPVEFSEQDFFGASQVCTLDYSDVKGQEGAKKALEIAAAGSHNILLIGPPGSGKSMLASRLLGIMPPMTLEESIESSKIHSIAELTSELKPLLTHRPFRAPHHTLSHIALTGGGSYPKPGEISLANNGVLFLDEFPEFDKRSREVLRQPIENREVVITRVNGTVTYPASFLLVCAMNPCKCGYFGHPIKECVCSVSTRKAYISKLSGPILDRIDLQVEVGALEFNELDTSVSAESSVEIRKRVCAAKEFALSRFDGERLANGKMLTSNALMQPKHIRKYCTTDEAGKELLYAAFNRLNLSARGYDKVLKVARTIADFDKSELIKAPHIAFAVQLRSLDKKYNR
ncbi:MAG: magnesium chelatase [Firmicutes bacterium HGW-Firmicutes-21]|nr:MAG: magnesium chelatase [Firmicutes bacterium HGW-Firmicutes-21]